MPVGVDMRQYVLAFRDLSQVKSQCFVYIRDALAVVWFSPYNYMCIATGPYRGVSPDTLR